MSAVLFLSWTATIATIGFFISGTITCNKMVKSGSTENVPLLPFVTTFLNCMMWASYGILKGDAALIPVNITGMFLQVLYILCFFFYCKSKHKEFKSLLYAAFIAVVLYLYLMHYVTEETERVARLGFACIVFTVAMQASPLAVVAKVVRTKSTESMPFIFSFMMVFVSFLWLCYGMAVEDINIQVPNASGVLLGLMQLSLFCIYPSKP
ncbi:hypothetical protein OS493_002620 [Desmophyllum pertusum]|uniref:Sugar transporter SWEET1 n=1 Tax=Desmophyllum pertusum TaxID=174260 RepID=A0A9X0CPS7_9CNID|nr:hypothetical protein OS493_002620 [Desmophyllum pertusum]